MKAILAHDTPLALLVCQDDALAATVLAVSAHLQVRCRRSEGNSALAHEIHDTSPAILIIEDGTGVDALAATRTVRAAGFAGVVCVAATDGQLDLSDVLTAGGDDHLDTDTEASIFAAKLGTYLRRLDHTPAQVRARVTIGDLTVDFEHSAVFRSGERLDVGGAEFDILSALARNPDRALGYGELAERIAVKGEMTPSTVRWHVAQLRRQIEPDPSAPRYIEQVAGTGYRLGGGLTVPPVTAAGPELG